MELLSQKSVNPTPDLSMSFGNVISDLDTNSWKTAITATNTGSNVSFSLSTVKMTATDILHAITSLSPTAGND